MRSLWRAFRDCHAVHFGVSSVPMSIADAQGGELVGREEPQLTFVLVAAGSVRYIAAPRSNESVARGLVYWASEAIGVACCGLWPVALGDGGGFGLFGACDVRAE